MDDGMKRTSEATARWESGVRLALADPDFTEEQLESVDQWTGAREALALLDGRDNWSARLLALWLEHRASELEAMAVEANEIGDHLGAERLADKADARRDSALDIRRELLGEGVEGG